MPNQTRETRLTELNLDQIIEESVDESMTQSYLANNLK